MAQGDFDFKNIEDQVQDLIPAEAKKFLNSLTAEDRNVLKDIANKSSQYSTVDDVLNELKTRSSTLYEKAVGVVKFFRDTLDSLSPSARKFVEDTIQQLHGFVRDGTINIEKIKSEINKIVQRYLALDDDTKDELKNAFPIVSTIVHNAIFQTMAQSLLGFGGGGNGGSSSPAQDIPSNDNLPSNDDLPKDNTEETVVRKTIKLRTGEQ
uniref:Fatty-acid and retinol-binding protein 1 n=1 Tax=Acrobeloides nanus TaxID=290746 RepID=A0A914EE56_9BILA